MLVSCWSVQRAGAQAALQFRQLAKADGLSQVSVFAIEQDEAGFLWVGTRDGLNRYDGYEFRVYQDNGGSGGPMGNDVRSVYADPDDAQCLWVGTLSGLSRYATAADTFKHYNRQLGNAVSATLRDSEGRLWLASRQGIALLDAATDTFRLLYEGEAHALLTDKRGQLWAGTDAGLFRLDTRAGAGSDSLAFVRVPVASLGNLPAGSARIRSLAESRDGDIWIGTAAAGLHRWSRRSGKSYALRATAQGLADDYVRNVALGPNDNIWAGTFGGLSVIDPRTEAITTYPSSTDRTGGLADESIHAIYRDARGGMWVGTYYGGLAHYEPSYGRFTVRSAGPEPQGLGGAVVSSFAEDSTGGLYIGTEGGGLDYLPTPTGAVRHFRAKPNDAGSLSGPNVKTLLLDGERLWVGTYNAGLNLLNTRSGVFTRFRANAEATGPADDNVYALLRRGTSLFALTHGGGLSVLDLTGFDNSASEPSQSNVRFTTYAHSPADSTSLVSDRGRALLLTSSGELLVGTEEGLDQVVLQNNQPQQFKHVLRGVAVYALLEGTDAAVWVGTHRSGLARVDLRSGAVQFWRKQDGLPSNSVLGIEADDTGKLWLSTTEGLSCFDPSTESFTNLNYLSGPQIGEYTYGAHYRTRSGELLFGGTAGFARFDPATLAPNTFEPPIAFTSFRQNGQEVRAQQAESPLTQSINATEELTFEDGGANFSITIAALDFLSPTNNKIAYLLEGVEKDWTYTDGQAEATYTIQREGKYKLRAKGANGDGLWNPQERTLNITVLPPWWRTTWAYFIYLIALGAAMWVLVRFISLRHSLQLQRAEQTRDDELHEMKLRFFTNVTHEFRTPLTLILGPLRELRSTAGQSAWAVGKLAAMERSAERLLDLVNQILTFRRLASDHEPMRVVHADAVAFAEEVCIPFRENASTRGLTFSLVADARPVELWFDADKLEQVLINLLSNAYKFTPPGGSVIVEISSLEGTVELRVRDTGPGIPEALHEQIFQRFYEKSGVHQSQLKGTGIGLAVSRQLVALHQGTLSVESTEGEGATFIIRLPQTQAPLPDAEVLSELPQRHHHRAAALSAVQQTAPSPTESTSAPDLVAVPADDQRPRLLIVEDHEELRQYLATLFADEYVVQLASDGVEGLELATAVAPDMILSDVMMPRMDGVELCRTIKSTLATSHVPVILLTARTAEDARLESLKLGADDYLAKPFHPQELKLRVRNIIAGRALAREKFIRVVALEPKEVSVTSADEEFLTRAIEIVERHLDNPDLSVNQFAAELAVSRALLFTKVKALTGQTPKAFVKMMRLKRAAQLLSTNKLNVSEVAYMVGFRDPKYFQKGFKAQFGVTPSAYKADESTDVSRIH